MAHLGKRRIRSQHSILSEMSLTEKNNLRRVTVNTVSPLTGTKGTIKIK
jgi:hypothetical protein